MLTTAMVQSKRYRVLERQNLGSLEKEMALVNKGLTDKSGVQKGQVKGADLLVMGAITGWEPGTSGGGGGLGGGMLGKASAHFRRDQRGLSKNPPWPWISVLWTPPHLKCWPPPASRVSPKTSAWADSSALSAAPEVWPAGWAVLPRPPWRRPFEPVLYNATKYIVGEHAAAIHAVLIPHRRAHRSRACRTLQLEKTTFGWGAPRIFRCGGRFCVRCLTFGFNSGRPGAEAAGGDGPHPYETALVA